MIAAPACIIAVFTFDQTLLTLWVVLAVVSLIIVAVSFYKIRGVDFEIIVFEKKKFDEKRKEIKSTNKAL